jgi:hypothetical protein
MWWMSHCWNAQRESRIPRRAVVVNQLVSPLVLPGYLRLRWPATGVLCCHCRTEADRSGRIRQIRQLA